MLCVVLTSLCASLSLSRNPIGDDGFCIILDALIKKPDALKRLGYVCIVCPPRVFVSLSPRPSTYLGDNKLVHITAESAMLASAIIIIRL